MTPLAATALGAALVASAPAARAADEAADEAASIAAEGRFATLFEPSGVAQLPDGTLLVVEDEAAQALRRVSIDVAGDIDGDRPHVRRETVLTPAGGALARFAIGPLDDLEGAASDGAGRVFAIGSHGEGRRSADRRKLVRFSVRGDEAVKLALTRDLRRDLILAHPALAAALDDGGEDPDRDDGERRRRGKRERLNIEGLAHDRRRGALLIGLRSPRLDERAVIVRLRNPDAYVADGARPAFDPEPWTLDLDEGGIRAMGYDEASDRLLLVSRRETRGGGRFELWHARADGAGRPTRVRLPGQKKLFDDVEGLAVLERGPDAGGEVLFVRDDGRRAKGRGADWFVLTRAGLGLDRPE